MVLFKCYTQCAGLKKIRFHSNPKERQHQECSNYHTAAFISHANKGMLKILQARLQQHVNREIPDIQAGFRKGRGTRDQITNIPHTMGQLSLNATTKDGSNEDPACHN